MRQKCHAIRWKIHQNPWHLVPRVVYKQYANGTAAVALKSAPPPPVVKSDVTRFPIGPAGTTPTDLTTQQSEYISHTSKSKQVLRKDEVREKSLKQPSLANNTNLVINNLTPGVLLIPSTSGTVTPLPGTMNYKYVFSLNFYRCVAK